MIGATAREQESFLAGLMIYGGFCQELARRLGRRSRYHDIHAYDRCNIMYSIFNILLKPPSISYLIMQDDVT